MRQIKLLWNGDVPLWITFWLYGVVAYIALDWISNWLQVVFIKNFASLGSSPIYVLSVLLLLYTVLVWIAIWRSSGKYKGHKGWAYASRLFVVVSIALNVTGVYYALTTDTNDPEKDSYNIEASLEYDEGYPWVGFWKESCSQNFGLAINKAGEGYYSVSFCGPGGCFKADTYRPNTKLEGDPSYRLINEEKIEVKGKDGFTTYHRCGS